MKIGGRTWQSATIAVFLVGLGGCGGEVLDVGDLPNSARGGNRREVTPESDFTFALLPNDPDAGGEAGPEAACRCTRGPGNGNSFRCPMGAGASITRQVGPAGGVVALTGTASTVGVPVELHIPPNALSETVSIRITETSIPPSGGIADWSPLYYFEPAGLTFNTPVKVEMPWENTSGLVSDGLSIYWSEQPGGYALAPLADDYQNAGFNQGSVRHLGWAIVGVPRSPSSTCP